MHIQTKETVATPAPVAKEAPVTPKVDDLMKNISKPDQTPVQVAESEVLSQAKTELDQIKDPVARKLVEDKIRNLEKGYNQKYMSLADEKRVLEAERNRLNAPWTPDRLKSELAKQDFISSAQTLNSMRPPEGTGVSDEQWSYLTPDEKAQIMRPIEELNRKISVLETQNQSVVRDKIDTTMKSKWGDYDPSKVDQFFQTVNDRRLSDEQLIDMSWKALNFDRYVERAHKLGLEGRQSDLQEKFNSTSFSGSGNAQVQEEPPKRGESENSQTFFKRLADWRRNQSVRKV